MFHIYKLTLTLHVAAIISWMAGILYLFRLFVYHAAESEAVVKSRFKIMESRLYRYITRPAMVVAFVAGVTMVALQPTLLEAHWFHAKLFFVFWLIVVTFYGGHLVKAFEAGTVTRSERYFRVMNEVPTLLMLLIVGLVIMRPF